MAYEVYEPGEEPNAGSPDDAPWQIAVEYSNDGQRKPPTVIELLDRQHPDRATALAAARRCAFEFDPPDPFSPQARHVYRDGPDGFLVVIHGAMSTFHMSVRVVQHVGQA